MSAAFVVEAVDAIMSAALANLDGLEVVELLSPARSAFGIAFDLTDQFKSTPRTGVQSQARARLEGYVSTPVKEGQPKSPAGDSLPRLLSEGRAAKLHIENEAKRQAAECARAKEVERARSLSDWLKGKVSHALEKRKDLLAEVSQKAKMHAEAVEGTLRRVQEAEEHRREELKAKLEPRHALEKRKEVLAEVSHKAKKHAEAVESKLRRAQEAEEHRREELKAKLERKTGSKVSGKVSDAAVGDLGARLGVRDLGRLQVLEAPVAAASKKVQPSARAGGEAVSGSIIRSSPSLDLEGLEGMKLLSPARSAFGIAFDLTDQFKSTPRTGVQSQARARLEGYVSTPVKEGQPRSPAGDSSPRLLSEGRAAKLHIENEAKRQAAECARAKEVERARSLSDWLKEKVSHALEKREEVLTGVSQKAKRHAEAVEGKLRRVQEAEEHRREELKAKLEPSHTLEKRKYLLAEVSHKAKKHAEAVEGTLRRVQEAEEHPTPSRSAKRCWLRSARRRRSTRRPSRAR
ncbi:unnamed protein product [Prorocentrum cordatum]|uniref:Uncharacterized protein n=1 Tax=Prorocentrum cordatum TaxID=2364126 RepID=A0ABN9Y5R2_9DINO|nr:unnamed protein product [Polarella glacialis]